MPHDGRPATVLVVSPIEDDHFELRRLLRDPQWRVLPAQTLQQAWLALRQQHVDIVITECSFPDGLSWRDLLEEVHEADRPQPLIVASHRADECLWAEVLNLGGYDLLMKPFHASEVLRVLEMAARHARSAHPAGVTGGIRNIAATGM